VQASDDAHSQGRQVAQAPDETAHSMLVSAQCKYLPENPASTSSIFRSRPQLRRDATYKPPVSIEILKCLNKALNQLPLSRYDDGPSSPGRHSGSAYADPSQDDFGRLGYARLKTILAIHVSDGPLPDKSSKTPLQDLHCCSQTTSIETAARFPLAPRPGLSRVVLAEWHG
jgi:hypothetical protein